LQLKKTAKRVTRKTRQRAMATMKRSRPASCSDCFIRVSCELEEEPGWPARINLGSWFLS